eukprot:5917030-Pleurochrysis_carterae.AAC.2
MPALSPSRKRSEPRTGLPSRTVAGGKPDEAFESALVVDGQSDRRPSAPQPRTLPLRSSRSCIHVGSAQRCS